MSTLCKRLTEPREPPELWRAIAIIAGLCAVVAGARFPLDQAKWKRAEDALSSWTPAPARIEEIQRRHRKGIYETFSGSYRFDGRLHRFRSQSFDSFEFARAVERRSLHEGSEVTVHVNPANPAEHVFEARAQVFIFNKRTGKGRSVAALGGVLCVIGIVLHQRDRRRFATSR
jgi:hypothetical protein